MGNAGFISSTVVWALNPGILLHLLHITLDVPLEA